MGDGARVPVAGVAMALVAGAAVWGGLTLADGDDAGPPRPAVAADGRGDGEDASAVVAAGADDGAVTAERPPTPAPRPGEHVPPTLSPRQQKLVDYHEFVDAADVSLHHLRLWFPLPFARAEHGDPSWSFESWMSVDELRLRLAKLAATAAAAPPMPALDRAARSYARVVGAELPGWAAAVDAWSAAEAAAGVDAPAMASLPPTFERLVAASRALRDALAAEDEADGAPATPLDAAVRACLAGAGTVVDVPAPRRDLGYDPHRGDACRHAAARCLVAVAAVADAGPIPHEAESLLAMLGDLGMSVMFLGRNLDDGQYPWGASSVAQRATYAVDYLDRWLGRPPPPAPAEAPP